MPSALCPYRTERDYQRLLARVRRRYDVRVETIEIGPLQFAFHRVADPNVIFDQMVARELVEGSLPWQPYWAENWDAALTMAHQIVSRPIRHGRVMDLGCGLGLTGAAAAGMGNRVLMADIAPPAMLFSRLNSWAFRQRVRFQIVDWIHDRLDARFDWIVGSDITYDRVDWPALEPFARHHLASGGHLLLGDPCRPVSTEFIAWLEQHGWRCRVDKVRLDGAPRTIRIVDAWLV